MHYGTAEEVDFMRMDMVFIYFSRENHVYTRGKNLFLYRGIDGLV